MNGGQEDQTAAHSIQQNSYINFILCRSSLSLICSQTQLQNHQAPTPNLSSQVGGKSWPFNLA